MKTCFHEIKLTLRSNITLTSVKTDPNRVTRPLEEAVMEPSSSMVYSAEMLSCRNRPSGSFFCSAYHFPAYCGEKEPIQNNSFFLKKLLFLSTSELQFTLTLLGSKSSLTMKLSTTQEADRQRSTQARKTSSRASLEDSILHQKQRLFLLCRCLTQDKMDR